MRKVTLVLIAAAALAVPALLAVGVHLAAGTSLTSPPAAVARVSTEPIAAPAEPPADVSGPCDEAEHRNDPRCAGGTTTTADEDRSGSDNSGKGRGRGRGRSGGDD